MAHDDRRLRGVARARNDTSAVQRDTGDLALGRVGLVATGLVAVIVLVVVAAFVLLDAWQVPVGGADASDTERDARSLPSAPQLDLKAHRARKRARLESTGWVDRERGIAHVSIDEAQQLILSGVPASRGQAAAKLPLGAASPPPPRADFAQHPGAQLPLDLALVDSSGGKTRLGSQFADARPVLLALGYYRCPNLCGIAMHALLDALKESRLSVDDYRIVGVSIDPDDTPASARARAAAFDGYARFVFGDRAAPLSHLFVADADGIDALASRVGFAYARMPDASPSAPFAHPTGFVVVTPEGQVSRYLFGVRFDAAELRLALVEASSGRIGGFSDRVRLLCAHFDPALGRYSEATMNAARVTGVLTVLLLGGWIVRRLRDDRASRASGGGAKRSRDGEVP